MFFEKKKRLEFKKWEYEFLFYKSVSLQPSLPKEVVLKAKQFLNVYKRNNNFRNYCIITGRARGVYKKFQISRFQIRQLNVFGLLPGLQKESW